MIQPWVWPLDSPQSWPDEPGQFGAIRRYDIHTGVDLYCPLNTQVLAVEAGRVVAIENFTGASAGSPWWNETKAVLVEGASGVVVYGEINPYVELGDDLSHSEVIGIIDRPVLKKDKGRPTVMLHIELMQLGSRKTVWWLHDTPQPKSLLNPTNHLLNIFTKSSVAPE